jgi:hypothetical protein
MVTRVHPEIGEWVIVCHHRLRLSQQELAKRAQIHADYLCGWIPFPCRCETTPQRWERSSPMNRPESYEKSVSMKRTSL